MGMRSSYCLSRQYQHFREQERDTVVLFFFFFKIYFLPFLAIIDRMLGSGIRARPRAWVLVHTGPVYDVDRQRQRSSMVCPPETDTGNNLMKHCSVQA